MCSHSCSRPGWQNRGCQSNGSNVHLHSYEVMWVKCLHQGRKDRDSDAAGFKPPTLWSHSWAYSHTLTLYVHLILHRFRKTSSGALVLGDFLAFLAPLSFQLIDLCECYAARASLRWKLQDVGRSHDSKTFGFPLIFWEGERELGGVLPPEILASKTKLKSLAGSLSDTTTETTVNIGSITHGRKTEFITITFHDFLHWNHE